MRVLGLESSCDDTGLALVDSDRRVLGDVRASQVSVHSRYKGVVPELAAREHVGAWLPLVQELERQIGAKLRECVDVIAVTQGPGLIGGLLVGVQFACGMGLAWNKPVLGVNHLAAHALTPRLSDAATFPYLLLLASGGHCFFALVRGARSFEILGETLDDAAGEAFDKVAALLDLGFPGGPKVEQAALMGDASSYTLPTPLQGKTAGDVSFSGLKNAVRLLVQQEQPLTSQKKANIAAVFQKKAIAHLCTVLERHCAAHPDITTLAVAGGVAANAHLRSALLDVAARQGKTCLIPPPGLCTDNGAMIAWCGLEWWQAGYRSPIPIAAKPRWYLQEIQP
ncbi:MAG: tRNA (adenosine(37)-N6)-threonylcarbamoyltransferase complex transferase subunit TsaD [Alphaproteobacteria bacterium]|jgi:N6-L-threonylcarbamoyladenine synthase|nr:tRNA (adenosine(37)-N6)-threonylcarbamoyltransferase complex transferase subunit TsaD [Alphaproteobacteria bacterium]